MACPICRSHEFYVKDPDDEYETYDFKCQDGQIKFDDPDCPTRADDITPEHTVFCQRCAWKGPYKNAK